MISEKHFAAEPHHFLPLRNFANRIDGDTNIICEHYDGSWAESDLSNAIVFLAVQLMLTTILS